METFGMTKKLINFLPTNEAFIWSSSGLTIHGCLGLEIPGLVLELGFFCHLCWSCTELVFGICDF